jgi:hypothetical protein
MNRVAIIPAIRGEIHRLCHRRRIIQRANHLISLYDPTQTLNLPPFPLSMCLIPGFALSTQRSALLSPQIC